MPLIKVGTTWVNPNVVGSVSKIVKHDATHRVTTTRVFNLEAIEIASLESSICIAVDAPNRDEDVTRDNEAHETIIKELNAAL